MVPFKASCRSKWEQKFLELVSISDIYRYKNWWICLFRGNMYYNQVNAFSNYTYCALEKWLKKLGDGHRIHHFHVPIIQGIIYTNLAIFASPYDTGLSLWVLNFEYFLKYSSFSLKFTCVFPIWTEDCDVTEQTDRAMSGGGGTLVQLATDWLRILSIDTCFKFCYNHVSNPSVICSTLSYSCSCGFTPPLAWYMYILASHLNPIQLALHSFLFLFQPFWGDTSSGLI